MKGRPREYLRLDEWSKFLKNDFLHLKVDVLLTKWIVLAILAAVVGKLIVDFFW